MVKYINLIQHHLPLSIRSLKVIWSRLEHLQTVVLSYYHYNGNRSHPCHHEFLFYSDRNVFKCMEKYFIFNIHFCFFTVYPSLLKPHLHPWIFLYSVLKYIIETPKHLYDFNSLSLSLQYSPLLQLSMIFKISLVLACLSFPFLPHEL